MSALAREMVSALADELAADPVLAETVAVTLAPYLPGHAGRWLGAQAAADYLGLGSLDALDRLVLDGLPYVQPSGPNGRRYFERAALDRWLRGAG